MKKIRLLINLYPMETGRRLEEISLCLQKNVSNPLISEITVLDEGFPKQDLLNDPKVQIVPIDSRPDFADYYQHLSADCIHILSNNDIWFDARLNKLKWLHLNPYDLLCLSRTEPDGKLYQSAQGDAQDSWVFLGKAAPLKECNFPMGIPGCENRLAFLFFAKRYRVLNPARVIRTHHEHASQQRGYREAARIEGHYLLTRPVGLFGFHFYRALLKLLQLARILRVKRIG